MYFEKLMGLFIVFGLFSVIGYFFMSFGLYSLAKRQNLENPWLAFVPVAQLYIVGMLIKDLKVFDIDIPRIELVLPIGAVLIGVIGLIPLVGQLAGIAYMLVSLFAYYKLYEMYVPEKAVLYIILSIVLPISISFIIFSIRDKSPIVL